MVVLLGRYIICQDLKKISDTSLSPLQKYPLRTRTSNMIDLALKMQIPTQYPYEEADFNHLSGFGFNHLGGESLWGK
jgi:hypothetical protein